MVQAGESVHCGIYAKYIGRAQTAGIKGIWDDVEWQQSLWHKKAARFGKGSLVLLILLQLHPEGGVTRPRSGRWLS